jgi:hypothetical protein
MHTLQPANHSLRRKEMEFIWEYIATSIPKRVEQHFQQRQEVARLIAKQRHSSASIIDKIK